MQTLFSHFAAALLSSPTQLQPASAPKSIACASPAGYYDQHPVAPATAPNVYTGRIRLLTINPDARWAASTGLMFELEGKPKEFTGVQVYVDPARPSKLTVGLRRPGTNKPSPIAYFNLTSSVPIGVKIDGNVITAWAGKHEKSLRLRTGRFTRAFLMCSSGEFEFRP